MTIKRSIMTINHHLPKIIILLICIFFINNCSKEHQASKSTSQLPATESNKQSSQKKSMTLPGEDITLATVNGSKISQYDFEMSFRTLFGTYPKNHINDKVKREALQSLVTSRAIAQEQEKELTETDKAVLEKRLQTYREQILVKAYLARHNQLKGITKEMVQQYYDANPEKFGSKNIKAYEMITSGSAINSATRDSLINVIAKDSEQKDWQQWNNQLNNSGYALFYRKGDLLDTILTARLREFIDSINPGEKPRVTFINNICYIVRVLEIKKTPPRPLSEVSMEIKKILETAMLKKAVHNITGNVLAKAEVVFHQ